MELKFAHRAITDKIRSLRKNKTLVDLAAESLLLRYSELLYYLKPGQAKSIGTVLSKVAIKQVGRVSQMVRLTRFFQIISSLDKDHATQGQLFWALEAVKDNVGYSCDLALHISNTLESCNLVEADEVFEDKADFLITAVVMTRDSLTFLENLIKEMSSTNRHFTNDPKLDSFLL